MSSATETKMTMIRNLAKKHLKFTRSRSKRLSRKNLKGIASLPKVKVDLTVPSKETMIPSLKTLERVTQRL